MKAMFYYFERDHVKLLKGKVTVFSSLVMPAAC
jgi:ABC-2 type transport system permease protein